MSFIRKFFRYEPTTELERISCCWKCKELNPETRTEYSFAGEHGPTSIHKCTTCGRKVTRLVHDGLREKLLGLLSKIVFSVCIVLTPFLVFYSLRESSANIEITLELTLFMLLYVCVFFVLFLSPFFGFWAYFKLRLKRRRAILEEIDRRPKPKPPPKKPNSLPPKIN